MPLVRIDLPESLNAECARRIGDIVNDAMIDVFNVPRGDKFQIIARHPPGGRNLTTEYLGITYSDKLILIQVTLNQGRTVELKQAFYKRVAEDITGLGLRKEDVLISLIEVPKENWSFGNGEVSRLK